MLGVGTDILKLSQIGEHCVDPKDPFAQKVYTRAEQQQAMEREMPLHYFATRFAGKEAVFKALNLSSDNVKLTEIEILADSKGQPHVQLHGRLAEHAARQGIGRVMISLSYDTEYAIAFAVALEA